MYPLSPGGLISTGSPAGVGWNRDPQRFLVSGDVIEVDVEISGVGKHFRTLWSTKTLSLAPQADPGVGSAPVDPERRLPTSVVESIFSNGVEVFPARRVAERLTVHVDR